jgi:hypothetical protein
MGPVNEPTPEAQSIDRLMKMITKYITRPAELDAIQLRAEEPQDGGRDGVVCRGDGQTWRMTAPQAQTVAVFLLSISLARRWRGRVSTSRC